MEVVVHWEEFSAEAPELASHAKKLFDKTHVVLLGTVRKDGSPRISPVEFVFFDGKLRICGNDEVLSGCG